MEILAGAIVSLITEFVTQKLGTNTIGSLAAYIGISVLAAAVYVLASPLSFWPTLVQIGTYAATIWAVLVHPITKNS